MRLEARQLHYTRILIPRCNIPNTDILLILCKITERVGHANTDKPAEMLLREYACIKSRSGDELVLSASGDTPAARTPNQLRVTFSVKEVSDEVENLQD